MLVLIDALTMVVASRSDLTGATVTGADFTNALVDRTQQLVRVSDNATVSMGHLQSASVVTQ